MVSTLHNKKLIFISIHFLKGGVLLNIDYNVPFCNSFAKEKKINTYRQGYKVTDMLNLSWYKYKFVYFWKASLLYTEKLYNIPPRG